MCHGLLVKSWDSSVNRSQLERYVDSNLVVVTLLCWKVKWEGSSSVSAHAGMQAEKHEFAGEIIWNSTPLLTTQPTRVEVNRHPCSARWTVCHFLQRTSWFLFAQQCFTHFRFCQLSLDKQLPSLNKQKDLFSLGTLHHEKLPIFNFSSITTCHGNASFLIQFHLQVAIKMEITLALGVHLHEAKRRTIPPTWQHNAGAKVTSASNKNNQKTDLPFNFNSVTLVS